MSTAEEYKLCSDEILAEYQAIKNNLTENDAIVCQHLGTFTQDILISIISLVDHALVQNGEYKTLKKRLSYLVIESIQNIMFHSDKLPDTHQLAYILVSKNKEGYSIYSSNSMLTKNINSLVKKLEEFLSVKADVLSKLFAKKIERPKISEDGHAGVGLLTMVSKSGKDFQYEITKVSENYSLFHIELKLKYKNYK